MACRGWLSRREKDILIPSNPFFEPAGEKIKPDMTFQAQVEVMNNVLKTHSKSEFWIFCDSWRVKISSVMKQKLNSKLRINNSRMFASISRMFDVVSSVLSVTRSWFIVFEHPIRTKIYGAPGVYTDSESYSRIDSVNYLKVTSL